MMGEPKDLQKLGEECLYAVQLAAEQVKKGDLKQAQTSLHSISDKAKDLEGAVSDMKAKLDIKAASALENEEHIQTTIGNLRDQEVALQAQEKDLEAQQQGQQASLNQLQTDLANKNTQIQQAEYELYKAKKHKKHKKHKWGPLGPIIEIIHNTEHKIDRLKQENAALQTQAGTVTSQLQEMTGKVAATKAQIDGVTAQITTAQQQRDIAHAEQGEVKAVLGFIMQAHSVWGEVEVLTDSSAFNTEALQKVVDLALGQKEISLHKSGGAALVVNSFKEAWTHLDEFLASNRDILGVGQDEMDFTVCEYCEKEEQGDKL